MSKLVAAQLLAAQAAATGVDMTEVQKGGGGKLLPAGGCLGRLVEYIEFGKQPQEFGGKAKDPMMEIQLGFALYGPGIQNDDGTPYILRPYSIALSRNDKAKAFKTFAKMNWKNQYTHFAQMIGEAFLLQIVHADKSKTDKTQVSRLDLDGVRPPLDALTAQPYPVPEVRDEDISIFLWDYPDLDSWNSLKIDGTYDDGKSKNRIQETILGATDFAGSPLEQLLKSAGLPGLPVAPAAPALPAPVGVAPAVPFIPPVLAAGQNLVSPAPAMPVTPVLPVPSPSLPTFPSSPAMP